MSITRVEQVAPVFNEELDVWFMGRTIPLYLTG